MAVDELLHELRYTLARQEAILTELQRDHADAVMDLKQAAAFLGISASSLREKVQRGLVRVIDFAEDTRDGAASKPRMHFLRSELIRYAESRQRYRGAT